MIGFILGSMLEDNYARFMRLYDGPAFIIEKPMTLALLAIAVILIVLPSLRAKRAEKASKGNTVDYIGQSTQPENLLNSNT